MAKAKQQPSEIIQVFLDYIEQCQTDYENAVKAVETSDRVDVINFMHDFEFAKDKAERNKIATRCHYNRVDRRKNKDTVDRLEKVVKFFNELNHKNTLNKLGRMLDQQRKTEEYLESDRVYKPRKGGMPSEN